MEQIPSWVSFLPQRVKIIPAFYGFLRFMRSPSLAPIPSQMNPPHAVRFYCFKVYVVIIISSKPGLFSRYLSFRFSYKRQYTIIFPLSTTYSNHPTYHDLNKLTKFGEKYILRGNFLYVQPPQTFFFLSRDRPQHLVL